MNRYISARVNIVTRFVSDQNILHSDWNDPMWFEYANVFKYAAGIRSRDIVLNKDHRTRFGKYLTAYAKRIEYLFRSTMMTHGAADIGEEYCPRKLLDNMSMKMATRSMTIDELLLMHLEIVSEIESARLKKPCYFYMPKDCYGENALRVRLRHRQYGRALDRALIAVECKMEKEEDFLFITDHTKERIEKLLKIPVFQIGEEIREGWGV